MTPITSGCIAASHAPASCSRASTLASGTNQAENRALTSSHMYTRNRLQYADRRRLAPSIFHFEVTQQTEPLTPKEFYTFRVGWHTLAPKEGVRRAPTPRLQGNTLYLELVFPLQTR